MNATPLDETHVVAFWHYSPLIDPQCYVCQASLPSPQRRRTFDFTGRTEVTKSLAKFVQDFATDTLDCGRHYLCKPCFARVDKARRGLESLETSINTLRAEIRGSPSPIHLLPLKAAESTCQPSSSEEDGAHEEVVTAMSTPTKGSPLSRPKGTSCRSSPNSDKGNNYTHTIQH